MFSSMVAAQETAMSCIYVSTNGITVQDVADTTVPTAEDMETAHLLSVPIPTVHKGNATKRGGSSSIRTKRGKVEF
jgi:hypothetical protein